MIAAAVGASLLPSHVLALGISNVLADALSMGVGEYLSSRSYHNFVRQELRRETWELENYPEGEVAEMVDLYVAKGMLRDDAEEVKGDRVKEREWSREWSRGRPKTPNSAPQLTHPTHNPILTPYSPSNPHRKPPTPPHPTPPHLSLNASL